MKVSKTISYFILNEVRKNVSDIQSVSRRISSGRINESDSPTSIALANSVSLRVQTLDFISQHITKNVSVLQKYEELLNQVSNYVQNLKMISDRASLSSDNQEFQELEKAYKENLSALEQLVRRTTIFSKVLGRGGFSNSVISVEVISGDVEFRKTDFNLSGLNFIRFGIKQYQSFQIQFDRVGDNFQATLFLDGSPVFTENKEVVGKPSDMPFIVDFEELGVSIRVQGTSDFSVKVEGRADPQLIVFGDGENDEERFFIPSLEPAQLGIPSDFEEGADMVSQNLEVVLKNLSDIRGFIGQKIAKLSQRNDLGDIIKSKLKILQGDYEDADMTSDAVILNLKQVILNSDISSLRRAVSFMNLALDMLRR